MRYVYILINDYYRVLSLTSNTNIKTTSRSIEIATPPRSVCLTQSEGILRAFLRACRPSLEHLMPIFLKNGPEKLLDVKSLSSVFQRLVELSENEDAVNIDLADQ